MNIKKKILIFFISVICIFCMKSTVKATDFVYNGKIRNPIYENINIEINKKKTIRIPTKNSNLDINEDEYLENTIEIAKILRDKAINRNTTFSLYMKKETEVQLIDSNIDEYMNELFNLATSEEYAENSSGGDYLKWSWYEINYTAEWSSEISNEKYINYIRFDIESIYFTTLEQEQRLDSDIQEYVNELDANLSDFEKIAIIYDYITTNIKYDRENLYDDTYILKYSAYAAFENKTAVCQGYANLLYKMLKEAGISDVRVIASESHAWNIVKFEDIYYCVDSTWDSEFKQSGLGYHFFLKGLNTFNDLEEHTMTNEFLKEEFVTNYPISLEDYIFPNSGGDDNGENGNESGNQTGNNEEQNNTNSNTNTNNTSTNQTTNTETSTKPNSNTTTNKQNIVANPQKITGFKLKTNYTNKVKLIWNKQMQITKYEIYLYNKKTKKYECKKTMNADSATATIKGLTDGTTYKFRIRAIKTINGKNYYGEYTDLKITTKPKKVTISKLKADKSKLTVFWKKVSNSNGYIIQYSMKSNFKNSKSIKIKNKKIITKTIQKLKNNKKYYIRIRAYKQVDGKKIYGDYSKIKNIKI